MHVSVWCAVVVQDYLAWKVLQGHLVVIPTKVRPASEVNLVKGFQVAQVGLVYLEWKAGRAVRVKRVFRVQLVHQVTLQTARPVGPDHPECTGKKENLDWEVEQGRLASLEQKVRKSTLVYLCLTA